jgi:flagellar biogenesis protein FliO
VSRFFFCYLQVSNPSLLVIGLTEKRIRADRVCEIGEHITSSEKLTRSKRINRYVPISPLRRCLANGQIKEAIERLVSLIEGEESQETSEQHLQELLKAEKAKKAEENDETDVVEV